MKRTIKFLFPLFVIMFTLGIAETDCAGVEDGTAYYDLCGMCVGGTTGLEPCFFDPVLEFGFTNDTMCEQSDFSFTVSQEQWESDIAEFTIETEGGSFNLDGLQIGDQIGSGFATLNGIGPWPAVELEYMLEVYEIMDENSINAVATIIASNYPDLYPVDANAAGFQLFNLDDGVQIYTVSPGDQSPMTNGYVSSITLPDIFNIPPYSMLVTSTEFISEDEVFIFVDDQEFAFDFSGTLGDVNGDGNVNVLDIVYMIPFIMGTGSPICEEFAAADVTRDNTLNVLDIVMIVDLILNPGRAKGDNVSNAGIQLGNGEFALETDGDVAGIELDIAGDFRILEHNLPNGWEFYQSADKVLMFSMDGSALNSDVLFEYMGELNVTSSIIADWHGNGVEASLVVVPGEYKLSPASPNPFNPSTTIEYNVLESSVVTISVYDMLGREVAGLVNSYQNSGTHSVIWNATDQTSGIYFVQMTSGDFIATQKIILMK